MVNIPLDISTVVSQHAALTKGLKMDRWHRYTRDGKVLTGVTSALGMIDKSNVLIRWAAREQLAVDREAAIDVAVAMFEDPELTSTEVGYAEEVVIRSKAGEKFDELVPKAEAAHKLNVAAIDLGHEVHALIEFEIRRRMGRPMDEPHVSDRAIELIQPWIDWADKVSLEPVLAEYPVFSQEFLMAGTPDLLGYVNGRLTLVDWKTSKAIYFESHLQNVAYRYLTQRMGLLPAWVSPSEVDGLIVRIPKLKNANPEVETSAVDVGQDMDRWDQVVKLAELSRFMKASEKVWKADRR